MNKVIRYFPDLCPDELLYSAFSRYSIQVGSDSFKANIKDLFGTENIVATWDFPSHIKWFIDNLNSDCYSTEDIIFKNTLLPLFYPFLDIERQQYSLEQMKGNNGKGIHMKLGVMASSINVKNSLNYCPYCISEDLRNHKTAYWHRSHNAPGVTLCYKHSVTLRDRCPVCGIIIAPKSKNKFIPLSEKCNNGHDLTKFYDSYTDITDAYKCQTLKVSYAVNYLLNSKIDRIDARAVNQRYLYYLKEKELVTPKGIIRQQELLEQFCLFYRSDFLNELNLSIDMNAEYNWLSDMLRRPNRISHPLKHILLIDFLTGDISKFLRQNQTEYYPFGKGPWLCLNPVAEHFRKPVVNKCMVSRNTDNKKPVGTFECSCGFIYSRSGADTCEEDKYKIGRIKSFGSVWEEKLKGVVQNQGGSLRSIAKVMKADPITIRKFVKKLGLEKTWNNRSIDEKPAKINSQSKSDFSRDEKRKKYIQHIEKYIGENNSASRSVIQRECQKEYSWLFRYDKELLYSVLPEPICRTISKKKSRVDWETRDSFIYEDIKNEIQRILSSEKSQRVTLSRIGKNLGTLSILEQHLDKLQRTKKLINNFYESTEAFQIRRATTVINHLINENETVKTWKVLRKAGLRKNCSEKVRRIIMIATKENLRM